MYAVKTLTSRTNVNESLVNYKKQADRTVYIKSKQVSSFSTATGSRRS